MHYQINVEQEHCCLLNWPCMHVITVVCMCILEAVYSAYMYACCTKLYYYYD